ncbi:hypothetical protein A2U01_0099012, partial [Trifolium medium]|nr:hypothetical protein [Trifolium medium]
MKMAINNFKLQIRDFSEKLWAILSH